MTLTTTELNLSAIVPKEEVGRETLSRYDMQFQAAAYAALEMLEEDSVLCVYCDYHDDFVVKRLVKGAISYHFFQVKTKGKLNYQWTLLDILAVKKKGQTVDAAALKKIRSSFIGKLLEQGVRFGEACGSVTLLSNVHFDDAVMVVASEWKARKSISIPSKFVQENFLDIFGIEAGFDEVTILNTLAKFKLQAAVNHIGLDREQFVNASRTAIYKYSEVDLSYFEITDLANNLLDMVYRRSKGALENVKKEDIESRAGITLYDLLTVLSISPLAYKTLQDGDDDKVIKTASILQRVLKEAGASASLIEFASAQKVAWDVWFRNARHIYNEFDLNFLLHKFDQVHHCWRTSGAMFGDLDGNVTKFLSDSSVLKFSGLSKELVFGGVMAALVRRSI